MSHHGYYIVGGENQRAALLLGLEKELKIRFRGNPDMFNRAYESFTIDNARELKELAGTRPIGFVADLVRGDVQSGGKKIFVLKIDGITVEAQNALLKLLEEPPEYAQFFLIVPSAYLLLPTVKSRLALWDGEGSKKQGETNSASASAEAFLKLPIAKRLETVKSLMDDIAKEKRVKRDAVDLLNALEASVYQQSRRKAGTAKDAEALQAMETARKYMNDRAPSMKMLLEYVALNI